MRNNSNEAKGKGFPLKITAVEVKVIDHPDARSVDERDLDFVKRILPTLEWSALVQVRLYKVMFNQYLCGCDYEVLTVSGFALF